MSFLQLVPLKSDEGAPLANKTKVKIILNLVAYERAMESFNEDMRGIYAKLKPEGYDAQAFPRVNELEKKENISSEEKQELESIKQSEEYLSYVEMKKTLMREFALRQTMTIQLTKGHSQRMIWFPLRKLSLRIRSLQSAGMKMGKSRLMVSPYWRRLAECL